MRLVILFVLVIGLGLSVSAQFYPESSAYWRGWDDIGGPPGFNVGLVMPINPDTLIDGVLYKRIRESNDASGSSEFIRDYFVRSDASGRGYVYLPDSAAEFLTGDLNAEAGDTVRDVLVSLTNSTDIDYFITYAIIDSLVSVSVAGTPTLRVYVNGVNGTSQFWQEGMGTISGPMLELSGQWWYCCVSDTLQYGEGTCPSFVLGLNDLQGSPDVELIQGPNPSGGVFFLAAELALENVLVYNQQGQLIIHTRERLIDLSTHGSGFYTAVVTTAHGSQAVRLMVIQK